MRRLSRTTFRLVIVVGLISALSLSRRTPTLLRASAFGPAHDQEAVQLLKHQNEFESLASAYHASVYRVEPEVEQSAWHADNPAQDLEAKFVDDTVHVRGTQNGTESRAVSFRLAGYGYGEDVRTPAPAHAVGVENRMEYRRDNLTEWYVNRPSGIEQGFVLTRPPGTPTGESLILTLTVESKLQPRELGTDIQFVDSADRVQLQYANLKAWDATDRELPARMQVREGRIALLIDDSHATYPVTIDPLIFTETKLEAVDLEANDQLGWSIAIDGDTLVAGAPRKSNARGAAYVFVRSSGVWTQQAKLTASDGVDSDRFGTSVAISGDTIVVSGPLGAVYVFVRSGGTWTQQAKLIGAISESFGYSVAINGDTVVAGAPVKASIGVAYVFVRTGTTWTQQAEVSPDDGAIGDFFAYSVAINGDTMVAGAPGKEPSGHGEVYVFVRNGAVWTQQAKLTDSLSTDNAELGWSVAISADTLVAGAINQDTTGAAYVFTRSGSNWSRQAKLVPPDAVSGDRVGYSVAVSGNTIVVGAEAQTTFNGAAYIFTRSGIAWIQQAKLTPSDQAPPKFFGYSAAVTGDTIAIGTPGQTGQSGAAYVYVDTTAADLLVSLGVDQTSVKRGDSLTYTLAVKNFGPNRAENVVINDTLSSGVTFVSAKANRGVFNAPRAGQSGTVTWYLDELIPTGEEEGYIEVTVIVRGKDTITNTATVSSGSQDPNPVNNSASITVSVSPGGGKN